MESHCPKLQNMVKFVEKKILRHTDIVSKEISGFRTYLHLLILFHTKNCFFCRASTLPQYIYVMSIVKLIN